MKRTASLGSSVMMVLCAACIQAKPLPNPAASLCGDELTRQVPERAREALPGSDFVRHLSGLDDDQREGAILQQLLEGNIPPFLRHLMPVHLGGATNEGNRVADVVLCVAPDYLAVGSDENFFLVPLRLRTALTVARQFRFALPTPRIVDAIYTQARMHLQPQPLPASDTMRTTAYYWEHNELVNEQRTSLNLPMGILTAGDKKDLVLTNRLWSNPGRVAIYGWHRQDGNPIQPLSTVHGARYADYSHGVRLISDTAFVDGEPTSLLSLLQNPRLAAAVSSEGEIRNAAALVDALSATQAKYTASAR
jgi:hypothetical protein